MCKPLYIFADQVEELTIGPLFHCYATPSNLTKKNQRYSPQFPINWGGIFKHHICLCLLFFFFSFLPLSSSYLTFIRRNFSFTPFFSYYTISDLIFIFNRIFWCTKDTVDWKLVFWKWLRRCRNLFKAKMGINIGM